MASGLVPRYKGPVWVIIASVTDGCVVDLNFCAREAYGAIWLVALGFGKALETLGLVTCGTFELHDLLSRTLHAANGLDDSAMVPDGVACISKLLVGELCRNKILMATATLDLWRKGNGADTDARLVTRTIGYADEPCITRTCQYPPASRTVWDGGLAWLWR